MRPDVSKPVRAGWAVGFGVAVVAFFAPGGLGARVAGLRAALAAALLLAPASLAQKAPDETVKSLKPAEGLEVKPVFIRGGPTAAAALVGGEVDYTFVGGVPAVRAIAQGAPLVIVGGIQPYMDYTLIGAKGITSLNDLQGKIVGVTGAGGIAEYAAIEGLTKKGLVRDRDYKILYGVGNSPARAQALEAGRIQASPFSFLERLELEQKGFPVLFEIGKVLPGFPFVVIISTKRKIETDPEGVGALLRAMKRSLESLKNEK